MMNKISKALGLTETEEDKTLSIFDENDNKICAIGNTEVSESEARDIRQSITDSWTKPRRIKIGEHNFFCLRVSDTLLGYGNFNGESQNSGMMSKPDCLEICTVKKKDSVKLSGEKFTLCAMIVDDLIIILNGRTRESQSLLKELRDIAGLLSYSVCPDKV